MAMDFGEMQTPFQKLSKMETEGNHRLGKGEMSRMWLSPLWKWNSERKRPHAKTRLVFVLWGHLCTASLQVILWLKMEFVLAPNLTSFALLLVHLPSCICHEFRRLADINPSWVCPPETWARPCESFSAATLLGCWDPLQALQRLQCLVPSQPACQPCRVRSPASLSGAATALAAFTAPSEPGCSSLLRWRRCGILFCETLALLSHSPFVFSLRIARMPRAKMQLLSTLKSTLCFCLFRFYICLTFPFCWYYTLKCKCQDG